MASVHLSAGGLVLQACIIPLSLPTGVLAGPAGSVIPVSGGARGKTIGSPLPPPQPPFPESSAAPFRLMLW
jgi:hypothetical protein